VGKGKGGGRGGVASRHGLGLHYEQLVGSTGISNIYLSYISYCEHNTEVLLQFTVHRISTRFRGFLEIQLTKSYL
jgi:hypothetical protein